MAGNKTIYDTAMKRAHEYAWANQWERAMKEYGRAITEFPNDRTAQRNLAQCMFRLKQWPQALAAYESLLALDATDAFALNRLAEIFLALGQQDRAVETYNRLADLYMQNSQLHEAIRALRDLSRVLPKNKEVHDRLLELAQEVDDHPAQATEHLALSQIALEASQLGEAQQHADAAAALDSDNPDIKRWVYTVRRRLAESAGTVQLTAEQEASGSSGGARTHLLSDSQTESSEVTAMLEKAARASESGDYERALDLYDQAVRSGAKSTQVFYSAGVLSHQMGRSESAIAFLERALNDPEFAMSANYVLGQCYSDLRNHSKAVLAFERALTLVDLDKLTRSEAGDLIELYKAAAEANIADQNPGRAASLFSTLATTFRARKWSHPELAEIEKRADELYNESIQSKLAGISRGGSGVEQDYEMGEGVQVPVVGEAMPFDSPELAKDSASTQFMGASEGLAQSFEGDGSDTQPPSLDTESEPADHGDKPTTMINKQGSNLRSITEYLRTSGKEGGSKDAAPGAEGTAMLPTGSATELLASLISEPFKDVVAANLPNTVLLDRQEQDQAVRALIEEGERAMSSRKWDAAIDSCIAIIGMEPDYLPIHMMLGDIYLRQGKVTEAASKYHNVMDTYVVKQDAGRAAEVCERLLQLQPHNPALQTRLGVLLMEAGKVDEAAKALLVVAGRHYQAGDTPRALEEARKLAETLPNSVDIALAVGTYHLSLGQPAEAVVEFSRALHIDAGMDIALIRLYTALVQMNDEAQWDALQSLIERSSNDTADTRLFIEELHVAIRQHELPALYYSVAVLAGRSGLDDLVADTLDQGLLLIAMSEEQDDSTTHESQLLLETLMSQYRGDIAISAKDWGIAARHYGRALDLLKPQPDGTVAVQSPRPQYDFLALADPVQLYYGLAEAQASQNNWDEALKALKALKTLMPEDHGVHTRLADIYFRQGNLAEALKELNEVLIHYQKKNDNDKTLETLGHMARLAPNNVAVRRKMSDLYLKLGMTDHGLTELDTLAELQIKAGLLKDAIRTYQKAADLHYTMGQHDKAISIYERIVRIAPRDLAARDQLVNMYIQSGKIKEAVSSERSLAHLFVQEGRTEEAIAALHQLLALSPEDIEGHHLLAKQLTALGEYGQAARLYGRLQRLDPDDDRLPAMQTELQHMADEAEVERKASKKRGAKE